MGDLERMLAMAGEIVGRFSPAPDAVIARGLTASAPGGSVANFRAVKSGAVAADARPIAPLELLLMLIVLAILAPRFTRWGPRARRRGGAESRLAAIVTVA